MLKDSVDTNAEGGNMDYLKPWGSLKGAREEEHQKTGLVLDTTWLKFGMSKENLEERAGHNSLLCSKKQRQ